MVTTTTAPRGRSGGDGPLVLERGAELAAAGALLEVAPKRVAPQRAALQLDELLADGLAVRLPGLPGGDEGRARLEHERLHLLLRDVEYRADLLVGDVPGLGETRRKRLLKEVGGVGKVSLSQL